jgi:hypothetical protein
MPKRRSLIGTAREAIGDKPVARPQTVAPAEPPVKRTRKSAPKPRPASAARSAPSAPAPAERAVEPVAAAPEHPPARPPSVYDAMAQFAQAAFKQNLETGVRLAGCKSPAEILAAQTAYATALTQSFFAASLRLMQLSLSPGSWVSVRKPSPHAH